MDNEEINSDLIRRYEDMLRCGERRYFDAEDIEDIAYEYELSEQYRDALGVIEYGLELHPGNTDLLVRRAGYLLCLDRIDEAERQIDEVHSHTADALLIQTEIALIRSDFMRAVAYIDDLLDSDELSLEICLDVIDLFSTMIAFPKHSLSSMRHVDDCRKTEMPLCGNWLIFMKINRRMMRR